MEQDFDKEKHKMDFFKAGDYKSAVEHIDEFGLFFDDYFAQAKPGQLTNVCDSDAQHIFFDKCKNKWKYFIPLRNRFSEKMVCFGQKAFFIEEGIEGIFSNTLIGLKREVLKYWESYASNNFDELVNIDNEKGAPYKSKKGVRYMFFYPIRKADKYRPFTLNEFLDIIVENGGKIKLYNKNVKTQSNVFHGVGIKKTGEDCAILLGSGFPYSLQTLLDDYMFEDGRAVGVLLEGEENV